LLLHVLLCFDVFFLQDFTGVGLQAKVVAKEVNTTALAALLSLLGVADPAPKPKPNYGWVAGPVVGGVAGIALIVAAVWFLRKRRQAARVPVSFSAAGTDAAVRIRRVADKYTASSTTAAPAAEPMPDGGTATAAAQVRTCTTVTVSAQPHSMMLHQLASCQDLHLQNDMRNYLQSGSSHDWCLRHKSCFAALLLQEPQGASAVPRAGAELPASNSPIAPFYRAPDA
jgi:hypothetical protein